MANPTSHPIDLTLWRRGKNAPKSEWWKWNWDTWDPLFHKFYTGEKDISELECPVCGKRELYAYFLAVDIAAQASEDEGQRVYIADRWFGCRACETQVRDRGEIPRWMREEEVRWASERSKELAEQKLDKNK